MRSLHCKSVSKSLSALVCQTIDTKINFGKSPTLIGIRLLVRLDTFGTRTHLESTLWKTVDDCTERLNRYRELYSYDIWRYNCTYNNVGSVYTIYNAAFIYFNFMSYNYKL